MLGGVTFAFIVRVRVVVGLECLDILFFNFRQF
jgi:hypothetical protein